jgi:hypothetical protein
MVYGFAMNQFALFRVPLWLVVVPKGTTIIKCMFDQGSVRLSLFPRKALWYAMKKRSWVQWPAYFPRVVGQRMQ